MKMVVSAVQFERNVDIRSWPFADSIPLIL